MLCVCVLSMCMYIDCVLKIYICFLCMCFVDVYVCTPCMCSDLDGQKRASDPLEMELHMGALVLDSM